MKRAIGTLTTIILTSCNTNNPYGPGRNYPEQEPRIIENIEFATNPTPNMTDKPTPYFSHIRTRDNYGTTGNPDTVWVQLNETTIEEVTRISHIAGNIQPEQATQGTNTIIYKAKAGELIRADTTYFEKK